MISGIVGVYIFSFPLTAHSVHRSLQMACAYELLNLVFGSRTNVKNV